MDPDRGSIQIKKDVSQGEKGWEPLARLIHAIIKPQTAK